MDGRSEYQPVQRREVVQYYLPPFQSSPFHQHPPVYQGAPLFPAADPAALAPPLPLNFQPAVHFQGQQVGSIMNAPAVAVLHGALPAGSVPSMALQTAPPFPIPNNQQMPSNIVQGPAPPLPIMANLEIPFDPNTPAPFADRAPLQLPRRHGVLKVMNIPFTISIPEMSQFIGKNIPQSHLITPHVAGYPIHIIMERSTGKTMDCYIEIKSPEAAAQDWEHAFGLKAMRVPKIGQRNVEVNISNQSELMKEMFPRAKCIHFDNEEFGMPKLVPNRDVYSSGYKGFLTTEELTCMGRHAEYPQRSQFAARSMNRTYESMISTLYKFPWYTVKLYSMRQALDIFKAYKKQLDVLIGKTTPGIPREVGLDNKLLMDLIFAGLNAPGFSERQKAEIVEASSVIGSGFPVSKHAHAWPFQTLSAHHKLSDQDVGMWLGILDIGMGVMESKDREVVGISPYLRVIRDDNGFLLYTPTEAGLELKRAQFSILEKRMMHVMMGHGWNAYQRQMGLDPSTNNDYLRLQGVDNHFIVGAAQVYPTDAFTAAGSNSNARPASGSYTLNNETGQREFIDDHVSNNDAEIDYELLEAGNTGVGDDSFNDPDQALAAMREVCDEVRDAASGDEAGPSNVANRNPEVDDLGAGLNNITLSNTSNAAATHQAQQARRSSTFGSHAASLNPESPAFEPPRIRNLQQPHVTPGRRTHTPKNSGSNLDTGTSTAFAGSGLGNGDFTTSPPRISTARGNNNGNVDKGKGKESALTAPAAGVSLQPAPSIPVLGPPLYGSHGTINVQGQGAQPFPTNTGNRERRGVTIRDPNDGDTLTTLRPTSAVETATATVASAPTTASGAELPLYRPRTRNVATPRTSTDGIDEASFDDTLDAWFSERTTSSERMAISAGMNMRICTPSSNNPSAPSTPPPVDMSSPTLRHSPRRENLRVRYEFDERLPMNTAETAVMPTTGGPSSGQTRYYGLSRGLTSSAPATPARTPAARGSGTGYGYRSVSSADPDTTDGGMRLPGTGSGVVPRNYGAIGDGSPSRRGNNATSTPTETGRGTLPGSPYPQRYVMDGAAAASDYRARLIEIMKQHKPIDEVLEEDDQE